MTEWPEAASAALGTLLSDVPRDKWGHPILPIPENMSRKDYERQLLALQIELVKMQTWAREENQRVLVVFEGRDSAGKGGTIQRMREHLNPRFARHVALQTPTDVERGQWYFQRYVEQLPTARRDRVLRPVLVQPGRRRAGDGVRDRRADRPLLRTGRAVRAVPRERRHPLRQDLAVDRAGGAGEAPRRAAHGSA